MHKGAAKTRPVQESGMDSRHDSIVDHAVEEVANALPGKHCVYSSLRTSLRRYGVNMAESELFMLCGSMCAEYSGDLKRFGPEKYPEQLQEMAASGGPVIRVEPWIAGVNDETDLLRVLTSGYGTMLHTSSTALTYHDVYVKNYPRGHVIELCGLDLGERTAQVNDSFLLDSSGQAMTYVGPARLDDLMQGIIEYAWLVEQPVRLSPGELHAACAYHIRQYVTGHEAVWRGVLSPDESANQTGKAATGKHVKRGDAGYRAFVDDFRLLAEMEDQDFRAYCHEIYYNLRLGSALHLTDYTADYCLLHQASLGPHTQHVIELAQSLYADWHKLNLYIYKTGLQLRKQRIPEIRERALSLIERQRHMLEELMVLTEQAAD
ncbi:hypothetical protein P4H61_14165 [Paenibacillus peoriae]|uniref:hypothetical protein n=1 Tax=Paenibacillus peoriae TaxID=59893 RepID=UPI00026C6471|nr:hypothetical protein [Paenibacillus peoriae]MEC0182624.1 hypothetical protein [Paenibacillus peoriae]